MSVTQLVYNSRNKLAEAAGGQIGLLRSIVDVSVRNNQRDGLTGFLIFDRKYFFQVLEGERDRVIASYNRIQKDPRHCDVKLMSTREVRSRGFPQWSMGGALRSLDHQEIFIRHGVADSLDPAKVTVPMVLALAMDLQRFKASRNQQVG